MIGVDEHVWRHTPRGSRYVTVVVDLTPRSDGRPARLLDVVEGRAARCSPDGSPPGPRGSEGTCGSWRWTRSPGTRRRSGGSCRTPGRSSTRSTSSGSPATGSPDAGSASNRKPPAGAARNTTRSTRPDESCSRPAPPSPTGNAPRSAPVRRRTQQAPGGHVGRLPEDHRLLRRTRPTQGARHDARARRQHQRTPRLTRPAN